MANQPKAAIPPGTLDMLILNTLARAEKLHGFEIAESILQTSTKVLAVEEGSLYPALQRILLKGWVDAEWGRTSENRRARYYRITTSGRKHLAQEVAAYRRVSQAIELILEPGN